MKIANLCRISKPVSWWHMHLHTLNTKFTVGYVFGWYGELRWWSFQIQYHEDFFKDYFYNYGFIPEVGYVEVPVAATMGATMPSKGWQILVFKKLPNGYVEEVKNLIWDTINIYSLFKTGQGSWSWSGSTLQCCKKSWWFLFWSKRKYQPSFYWPSMMHLSLYYFCWSFTSVDVKFWCYNVSQAHLSNYIQYRALQGGWTSRIWSK